MKLVSSLRRIVSGVAAPRCATGAHAQIGNGPSGQTSTSSTFTHRLLALALTAGLLLFGAANALAQTYFWSDNGVRDEGWPNYDNGITFTYTDGAGRACFDGVSTYTIYTPAQFGMFCHLLNDSYNPFGYQTVMVMNDLDMTGHYWWPAADRRNFSEHGIFATFSGTFDGQDYAIRNLTVVDNGVGSVYGLFGTVWGGGAVVRNVRLEGISFDISVVSGLPGSGSDGAVGGIAGEVQDATIENCIVSGTIAVGYNAKTGGIAGRAENTDIKNCHNRCNISANKGCSGSGYSGGIVGEMYSNGLVVNCSNTGRVESDFGYVGGIAGGGNLTEILNCWNSGDVLITRAVNMTAAGGIVGLYGYTIDWNQDSIVNCYNSGLVVCEPGLVDGIVGWTWQSHIRDCYSTDRCLNVIGGADTFGAAPGTLSDGVTSLLDALNAWVTGQGSAAYLPWVLDNSYAIGANGYPVFAGQYVGADVYTVTLDPNNNVDAPYTIPVTYGHPMPLGNPVPTQSGYIFVGYTNAAGALYYGPAMNSVRNWDVAGNGTLGAMWMNRQGEIAYFGNGGTPDVQILPLAIMPVGHEYYIVPEGAPTRPGYAFVNWNTLPDGSGTLVDDWIEYDYASSPTYGTKPPFAYAQWSGLNRHGVVVTSIAVDAVSGVVALGWPGTNVRVNNPKYIVSYSDDLIGWTDYDETAAPFGMFNFITRGIGIGNHNDLRFRPLVFGGQGFFRVEAVGQP